MKPRSRRLVWIVAGVSALGCAAGLVLNAFRANVTFFVSPTQIAEGNLAHAGRLRVGGLVARGSLRRDASGLNARFIITDTRRDVPVTYRGVLPDLFREGKGVVAEGSLSPGGVFVADQVLAKHDENYVPPDVGDLLKRARPAISVATRTSPDGSAR